MEKIILYLNIAILFYFIALSCWYTLILLMAFPDMIKTYREAKYGNLDQLMKQCTIPISIIIPAFNEGKRILNSLYSILQGDYQNTQIIVINDGSRDNTMNILIEEFSLIEIPPVINQTLKTSTIRHYYQSTHYKNLFVIDKEHSPYNNGADCNNAGLNAASTPLVVTLDADTILEPDAITNLLYSFLAHPHCISIGGTIFILNDNPIKHGRLLTRSMPKQFIPSIQCIEYLRSFTFGRAGLNSLGGALCYPGAFTLFETEAIKEFGGFDPSNFSYDAEITIKLQHKMRQLNYPTQIRFISNAVSWTVVPHNLKSFWNQRNRWQRGMLLSISKHMTLFFNPKYGITGLLTFPAYVLFEVFGLVIEFISYLLVILGLVINIVSWKIIGWYILLAWSYITLLSIATFYLSLITFNIYPRFLDFIRILWLISIEMLGFRQFKAAGAFYSTLQFIYNRLLGRVL